MVTQVEPPPAQFSGDESSATVSVSSNDSLDKRVKRWDGLKKRYHAAKYSLAKQRAASKTDATVPTSRTVGI